MSRKYNFIYSKLVKGENDVIGHIAYSLYKTDKIQYIEKFKSENDVDNLSEKDLKHFHDVSTLEASINRYRNTVLDILQDFSNYVISEQVDQIEKDYEKHLKKIISPLKTKWWEAILQSVIGAFVFAVIVAALAFVIQYKGVEFNIQIPAPTNSTQTITK